MPTPDEILEELRAHRRDLRTLFASSQDATGVDAAKMHEADAARHSASAASHRAAAKKARDDGDEEDAAAWEAKAQQARKDAATCRASARSAYDAAATSMAASDETASTQHAADAKRMKDEEDAAAAKDKADDDEMASFAADAAFRKTKDNPMLPMFGMFLRAMTKNGNNMDAMRDAGNLSLLRYMLDAMVYPVGPSAGKHKQSAAHDDTAEDTALFNRLIQQHHNAGDLRDTQNPTDLRVERKLRSFEAAIGEMSKLLTDVVHSMRDLATDKVATERGLSTDTARRKEGGPVRRTMSATGGDWRGKFDQQQEEQQQTEKEIDAALDEQGLDPVQRIAAKLMMVHSTAKH